MDLRAYTDQFIAAFREDARALGLEEVEETPRATDEANLRAMGDLVTALDRNGHTYRSDGSVYFKISTLPGYGCLARLDHERDEAGSARRYRQLRQGRRPRFRAVEGQQGRRADLGSRRSAGPAGLAPRVLGHGASAARRAADRHPHRGDRFDLPAPRERDRAERGGHRQALLALLVSRRVPDCRRAEDVEVARQHLHDSRRAWRKAIARRRFASCCCRRTIASNSTSPGRASVRPKRRCAGSPIFWPVSRP